MLLTIFEFFVTLLLCLWLVQLGLGWWALMIYPYALFQWAWGFWKGMKA